MNDRTNKPSWQVLTASGKRLVLIILCGVLLAGGASAQEGQQSVQPLPEEPKQIEPQTHLRQGNPVVYQSFQPCRMVDTRDPLGTYGGPKLIAGATRNFDLVPSGGACGDTLPVGAKALAINVTITESETSFGFLTVWPGGEPQPMASVINWDHAGATLANAIIVPVGSDGSINVFSSQATHLILDISGYFLRDLEAGDRLAISGDVGVSNSAVLSGQNNSTAPNVYAVLGTIRSPTPGANSTAVRGLNNGQDALGIGVWGSHGGDGWGVNGTAATGGIGVRGFAPTAGGGLAGHFSGNVQVTGTLNKGGGAFKIDHPLDPANKYLSHSFVESPDMMNIYNGNATTDARGRAVVTLPAYFTTLNRGYRYQLTVIGQFAQAVVASKIRDNRFVIKTNKPRVEVSWQVTGIRQDAYANAYRIRVEEEKTGAERGSYLSPELFGQPAEKSIENSRHPGMLRQTNGEAKKVISATADNKQVAPAKR